jgi:hypothetical protein
MKVENMKHPFIGNCGNFWQFFGGKNKEFVTEFSFQNIFCKMVKTHPQKNH